MDPVVLIVGYYHRKNLGDDVFEHVLSKYFLFRHPDLKYIFISADDLKEIPPNTIAVLFGGGDLINDYFYNKIRPFVENKTCPWYAISVGIPYPKLIESGYLDWFDFIIHRNQEDEDKLSIKYNTDKFSRSKWFPDISYLSLFYKGNNRNNNNLINLGQNLRNLGQNLRNNNNRAKKIGIFLSRSIYNSNDLGAYDRIISNIRDFLFDISVKSRLITVKPCVQQRLPLYELYFMPFCTDGKLNHDDRLINRDIYNKLMEYDDSLDNIHLVDEEININDLIPLFRSFDLTISTRFHAHMFSLMAEVPILSIYTTRKVKNLLSEIDIHEYSCPMKIHPTKYYPIELSKDKLTKTFNLIMDNYDDYKNKLSMTNELYIKKTEELIGLLDNLIIYRPNYCQIGEPKLFDKKVENKCINIYNKLLPLIYSSNIDTQKIIEDINRFTLNGFFDNGFDNGFDNISNKIIHVSGSINKYLKNVDQGIKNTIVEIISYELTSDQHSDYNYGLSQQVFTDSYNLFESCKWILDHRYSVDENFKENIAVDGGYDYLNNHIPIYMRNFNLKFSDNSFKNNYHRSGWGYVMTGLNFLHNPDGMIFDSYVDKTFGWNYNFNTLYQTIPYIRPWIGVLHHTANTTFSNNNLVNVFSKSNFIRSLESCQGLIVLSEQNKKWVENKLKILYCENVPVILLHHPTEFVSEELKFNYTSFKQNPVKKIIQIGGWLRNTYAIYDLVPPPGYHKYALKGKDMDNYYIPDEDIDILQNCIYGISREDYERNSCCLTDEPTTNKYILGLIDNIKNNHTSVTLLEEISDDEYDQLLVNNIVFVNLVDASAVNTLLECIIRNTPILINRLPAVEEYIGTGYPLFYNNLDHANDLLSDRKNVKKAYKYLKKLNKNNYHLTCFINSLLTLILNLNFKS